MDFTNSRHKNQSSSMQNAIFGNEPSSESQARVRFGSGVRPLPHAMVRQPPPFQTDPSLENRVNEESHMRNDMNDLEDRIEKKLKEVEKIMQVNPLTPNQEKAFKSDMKSDRNMNEQQLQMDDVLKV